MSRNVHTGLILRKETKFDEIRRNLFKLFFKQEYEILSRMDKLLMLQRPDANKIVIPREIKK